MRLSCIGWVSVSAFVVVVECGSARGQQVTWRASVDSAGTEANNGSYQPAVSRDGRFVAFHSNASNLVPGDGNGGSDVFVHDAQSGTTEIVSVDSAGVEGNSGSYAPALSADGRFVVFPSFASNLVSGDTNGRMDMFVRDRQAGTTERVSVDSSGGEANQDCGGSSISADGRFVVFQSAATNLVAGDANSRSDIFLHDRQTGTTELVSVDSTGAQGNGDSGSCVISADGSLVVFISSADNLVPGDTNGWTDVFVRDRQASTTERVSVDSSGTQADADCGVGGAPAISADGRYVAFQTDATNLVAGDTNGSYDIFVRDRQSGTTEIVSIDSTGTLGNAGSQTPCISADGRLVVFESDASNLIAADGNGWTDVFERDRQTGRTTRLSVSTAGGESSGPSYSPALSDDGRQAAFVSLSSDLIGGDANGWDDIYVRGRWLTLEAEPQIATAGATETLTTWSGKPLAPSVLVVIDVNGTPVFLPVLFGTFDAAGVESVSGTVPSGLSGHAITFATFGIVSTGKVQASNGAVVTFQ